MYLRCINRPVVGRPSGVSNSMKIATRNRVAGSATLTLCLVLAACGGGGGGGEDVATPAPDPDPVPGAATLQNVLAAEGVTTLPPPPVVSDELFALGSALFFDKILSGNNDVSCATCHWPELAGADARTLSRGVGGTGLGADRVGGDIIPRNSPTVLNAHLYETVFHDGRVEVDGGNLDTPAGASLTPAMRAIFDPQWELLAAQALFPVLSRAEMRGQNGQNTIANFADADLVGMWDALRDRLVAFTEYQALFLAAYPGLTSIGDIEFAHAANAIAAFEVRAFARTDSAFARFVAGDDQALTEEEVRGGLEFYESGSCVRCHSGSTFTDNDFHNIGLRQFGPGKGDGGSGLDDFGRERVTGAADDRYRFRTASLLNVGLTAPYGRLGQYDELRKMVLHYTNTPLFLQNYTILDNVTDPDLVGTLLNNEAALTAGISNRVDDPRNFDVDAVTAFLTTLTADSAVAMSALIPATVPSGLPVR